MFKFYFSPFKKIRVLTVSHVASWERLTGAPTDVPLTKNEGPPPRGSPHNAQQFLINTRFLGSARIKGNSQNGKWFFPRDPSFSKAVFPIVSVLEISFI